MEYNNITFSKRCNRSEKFKVHMRTPTIELSTCGIPNLKMFQSTGGNHKTSRSQQRPQKKHRRLSLYCFCDLIIYNPWIRSGFAVPAIAQFSSMSISRPAHLPCKLLIDPGNIWKLIIKIFKHPGNIGS